MKNTLTVEECEKSAHEQLQQVISHPSKRWMAVAVVYDEETKKTTVHETTCNFPGDKHFEAMQLLGVLLNNKLTAGLEPITPLPVANLEDEKVVSAEQ